MYITTPHRYSLSIPSFLVQPWPLNQVYRHSWHTSLFNPVIKPFFPPSAHPKLFVNLQFQDDTSTSPHLQPHLIICIKNLQSQERLEVI